MCVDGKEEGNHIGRQYNRRIIKILTQINYFLSWTHIPGISLSEYFDIPNDNLLYIDPFQRQIQSEIIGEILMESTLKSRVSVQGMFF